MKQLDLFEETANAKLLRLEKWMMRLQKQMSAVADDLTITKRALETIRPRKKTIDKIEQLNMFEGVV